MDCEAWAERNFGDSRLGDKRRTRRLVDVAAAFAAGGAGDGGGTITSVIGPTHQAKAAYRLLDRPEVTHDAVLAGHCAVVREAMNEPGEYILIEDSSTVDFHGLEAATGLGPIGESYTRGLWMHSALVVRTDQAGQQEEVLGFLGQQLWARPLERPVKRRKSNGRGKESNHARQSREDRESRKWLAILKAVAGPKPGQSWVYVADRESDIYEVFLACQELGCHYVIRACYARALAGEWEGVDLFTVVKHGHLHGVVKLELPREGRTAKLEVRSTTLELRGPSRPGGRLANTTVNVVHVQEIDPPEGEDALTWTLLTDLPVETLEQCQRVIRIYRRRWLIEEFHKALKTGMKLERSQLSDARRLGALTGILSIVASSLLEAKLAGRTQADEPLRAKEADPTIQAVLTRLFPPNGPATRRWLWVSIAKLGGFLGRKGDGHPGWLTLWRGWQKLMILVDGYEIAMSVRCGER